MKTIELLSGENRWDELVAALDGGGGAELSLRGKAIARIESGAVESDANAKADRLARVEAAYAKLREVRDRQPKGGGPIVVEILRELRDI